MVGVVITGLFVLIGLVSAVYGILSVLAAWRAAYAVTNRRALIVRQFFGNRTTSIAGDGLNALEWSENSNGYGSITLKSELHRGSDGDTVHRTRFYGVRDVKRVVEHLERLRSSSSASRR